MYAIRKHKKLSRHGAGWSLTQTVAVPSLFLHRTSAVHVNLFVTSTTLRIPLAGVRINEGLEEEDFMINFLISLNMHLHLSCGTSHCKEKMSTDKQISLQLRKIAMSM